MTNGERIRKMSDEELAEFLDDYDDCEHCTAREETCNNGIFCYEGVLDWLKQEAEG